MCCRCLMLKNPTLRSTMDSSNPSIQEVFTWNLQKSTSIFWTWRSTRSIFLLVLDLGSRLQGSLPRNRIISYATKKSTYTTSKEHFGPQLNGHHKYLQICSSGVGFCLRFWSNLYLVGLLSLHDLSPPIIHLFARVVYKNCTVLLVYQPNKGWKRWNAGSYKVDI